MCEFAIADVSVLHDGAGKEVGTVLIHSEIRKGDLTTFVHAVDSIKNVTRAKVHNVPFIIVDLDTSGGDVMEAVQIARIVRDRFMFTRVLPSRKCISACAFILMAGTNRTVAHGARVGLHRPKFESSYFAGLTAEDARGKYNGLIAELHKHFTDMGGSEEAFRIMLSVPSDHVRYLTMAEMERLGFHGNDPAWDELNDATFVCEHTIKAIAISRAALLMRSRRWSRPLQQP
jgi:hypothetical protein